MSDEPIAPYVAEGIDAGDELRTLGLAIARRALLHMQAIVACQRDYESDQVFHDCMDIDIYKAEFDDGFILYVVEKEQDGSLRLTLMLAGKIGDFGQSDERSVWSRRAIETVKQMVETRVEDFFE
ncbi:MAG: hypothetical protein QM773_09845 [Hyphomonadaceae bacterium]